MTVPFYSRKDRQAHPHSLSTNANAGLWYTRFFNQYDHQWTVDEQAKGTWIDTVTGQEQGNKAALTQMAERLSKLGAGLHAEIRDFKTDWHFATGLGISHPVENGLTWHHTLGVPYLPASGVKGMLRGWVESWMDHDDEPHKSLIINRWFGAVEGEHSAAESSAGHLIFFDALPPSPVILAKDIMTPHMGKWYEKGGEIKSDNDYVDAAPADWHSPVPVPFLVVKSANFRCMIAPRLTGDTAHDVQARQDAKDAMSQLSLAMQWMGAGAKIAAGYGRFTEDSPEYETQKKALEQQAKFNQMHDSAELWSGVRVQFNRSNQVLSVKNKNNIEAYAFEPNGKALLDTLPATTKSKVLQNGYVKVNARVSGTTLLSVMDIDNN